MSSPLSPKPPLTFCMAPRPFRSSVSGSVRSRIDQVQVPLNQRKYGYTGNNGTIRTPNIYKLAQEGMVFQNWYSGFHVCTPSRAAMMTGRLPVRSGIGAPNGQYGRSCAFRDNGARIGARSLLIVALLRPGTHPTHLGLHRGTTSSSLASLLEGSH